MRLCATRSHLFEAAPYRACAAFLRLRPIVLAPLFLRLRPIGLALRWYFQNAICSTAGLLERKEPRTHKRRPRCRSENGTAARQPRRSQTFAPSFDIAEVRLPQPL